MLSIHIHKSAKAAVAYHDSHLKGAVAGDYYQENDPLKLGTFFGNGIKKLGVDDLDYSRDAFFKLCSNRNPISGGKLTVRQKASARVAYDCVISAPKSVSILALVLKDERVLTAHRQAVAEALSTLETRALTRVRRGGEYADRRTENVLGVAFEHFTSREGDPQLHQHCLVFNATHDDEEKRWKALQSSGIYDASALITEVYRSALASKLHTLGYATQKTEKGFEVAGISREIVELFSKRTRQIHAIAKQVGDPANAKLRAGVARNSRKPKDESVSMDYFQTSWRNQLKPEDIEQLETLKASAVRPLVRDVASPAEAVKWAKDHLFERKSVVKKDELVVEALKCARGDNSVTQIETEVQNQIAKLELLEKGNKVTTPAHLKSEQRLLKLANDGLKKCASFTKSFLPEPKLSGEQSQAVLETLASTSMTTAIIGPAGAGKSTLLKSLTRGLRSSGIDPLMLAPSGSATEVLRKDGFVAPETLQRFLLDKKLQATGTNGVVILDESSMVSLQQMVALLGICKENNTRLILVGDTKQMQSVEAGDSFRLLLKESHIPRFALSTIIRQQHTQYRNAVAEMKDGKAERGFDILDGLGWVHEMAGTTGEERSLKLSEDFVKSVHSGRTALCVTHSWREADQITDAIRLRLKAESKIGENEQKLKILVPIHTTLAERSVAGSLEPGCVLVFRHTLRNFKRGERVTVVRQETGSAVVARQDGSQHKLKANAFAEHFSVFKEEEICVSRNDKLLLRSQGKASNGAKITNGEIVTVKAIHNGRIELKDGRILPEDYQQFRHGYAVSLESSQGKTVDDVYLAIDAQTAHTAGSLEGFYVGASRGRHICRIYTDAKHELRSAVQNTRAREAAIELLQLGQTYAKPKQERRRIPNNRTMADPKRRYPLHLHATARSRTRAVERDLIDDRGEAVPKGPLPLTPARTAYRVRRGLTHD
jgi:conjugative relaxase-like TrwC/TraI family protein